MYVKDPGGSFRVQETSVLLGLPGFYKVSSKTSLDLETYFVVTSD